MFGIFLAALDQTIVATTLHAIAVEFSSLDQIAWIGTAYLLTATVFQPTYGKLAAPKHDRGKYQGMIGGVYAITWRWAFYINLPFGAIAVICEIIIKWDSPIIITLLCIGCLGFIVFALVEKYVAVEPIAPESDGNSMFAMMYFIPLFFQIVKGATATKAGLDLLPFILAVVFAVIFTGQLISRIGIASQHIVAREDLASVTSLMTFFRTIGAVFGVAILGTVFNNELENHLSDGASSFSLSGFGGGERGG
ncbi:hypothetical protein C1646_771865 [Rhizophagus diaphanus]|nr:hypothetical protein C1646_771865 [Rhizophagus diaphanus] [Rhizophagus sp. MUCL 43196]